jgi:hypothetical protein
VDELADSASLVDDPGGLRRRLAGDGYLFFRGLPPLRAGVRAVLGPAAFSYPVKVLRAVYPERPQARPRGRYIHYDYGRKSES